MADDDESLDDILSTSIPTESEVDPPEAAEPTGPSRDEHGRFAPKEASDHEVTTEEPEEPTDPETPEGEHNTPVAAVIAERRKAQAAQAERDQFARELAEIKGQMSVLLQQRQQPEQPKPEPKPRPQLWDDPDNWGNSLVEEKLSPIQEQVRDVTLRASRAEAMVEFGKDAVTAAYKALDDAIRNGQLEKAAVDATLSKSRDPYRDIVMWHQRSPAVQETTLREKLEAEILAKYGIDPTKQINPSPTPSQQRNPIVRMPPSLNRIPAGHSAPERDESLDEVLSIPRRAARAG